MPRIDRHDRETFIAELLKAVPTATRADALRLLRWGRTYGRLCEAECNGDWPADNGEGECWTCPKCEGRWRSLSRTERRIREREGTLERACPSCRAERIIRETCARFGNGPPIGCEPGNATNGCHCEQAVHWHGECTGVETVCQRPFAVPHFQGDPHGHTVRLQIAGAPLDAYERPALAVPTS